SPNGGDQVLDIWIKLLRRNCSLPADLMKLINFITTAAFLYLFTPGLVQPACASIISNVKLSKQMVNPTLGESLRISATVSRAGTLQVSILDRDRFLVRKLSASTAKSGEVEIGWDGRDDQGLILPDEAYYLKIGFTDGKIQDTYDPSNHFNPEGESLKEAV